MPVADAQAHALTSRPSPGPSSHQPRDLSTTLTGHERILRVSLYQALARAVLNNVASGECLCRTPRVLDVGCGRGELLRLLVERGLDVTGLDSEPECVRIASQYAACFVGNGEDVRRRFQPRDFDVIVSSHVLEHVADPLRLLAVIGEMEAAHYVFAVPNVHRPARLVRALIGSARPDHPAHLHGWGRPEFEALLSRAGFTVVAWACDRVTTHPFGGSLGAAMSRALMPLEVGLLPRLFPLLSSSLIAVCTAGPGGES